MTWRRDCSVSTMKHIGMFAMERNCTSYLGIHCFHNHHIVHYCDTSRHDISNTTFFCILSSTLNSCYNEPYSPLIIVTTSPYSPLIIVRVLKQRVRVVNVIAMFGLHRVTKSRNLSLVILRDVVYMSH